MRRRTLAAALLIGAATALLLMATLELDVKLRGKQAEAKAPERFWTEGAEGPPTGRPNSFADLAEELSPAVVNIKTSRSSPGGRPDLFGEFFGRRFRRSPRAEATGTGFVISADGYIVTNNHVVENADRITVVFNDGSELPAESVGLDPKTDLALLKAEVEGSLHIARLGNSDEVRVGDWVMAIGNPFGLEHTVTVGILSAKGRNIHSGPYDDFLQTDASINPGNSGGPLIDMKGRVVGINTAINAAGQGIGFAIPINMAKQLLPQLREFGAVTRGWLGVQIQRVTPALAESFGLESPGGALVSQVFENSPAETAKLQRGDVIVEFDGEAIENFDDLPKRVAVTPPGTEVSLVVMRDGRRKKLNATLEEMEQEQIRPASSRSSRSSDWGFEAKDLNAEAAERLGLPEGTAGVVVVDVEASSPAHEAGLRPRDVILEANKTKVGDVDELEEALEEAGEQTVLLIQRGEGSLYLAIEKS